MAWVALGAGMSGTSTYVLLAAVAAGTGPTGFDRFSVYWAVLIVAAVGGYLPLEQIVARRVAGGAGLGDVRPWAVRWGLLTAAPVSLALVVALAPGLVVLFGVTVAGVAAQAVLRGLAAGTGRLDHYAAIVCCDAVLRAVLCLVLAGCGVTAVPAYAGAIAVGCWSSVALASALRREDGRPPKPLPGLTAEAASLVPAMVAMQVLLNSPVLLAALADGPGSSAGRVLAVTSLVRTAVFVSQAAQAGYVARIAALVHAGSPAARRTSGTVLALALGLSAATVAGSWSAGPWLVGLVYGDDLAVSRAVCLLAGAGVGVLVVAIVVNDLAVAHGVHRWSGRAWLLGLAVAAVAALLLPAGDGRTFLPLPIGSAVALALTVITVTRTSPPRRSPRRPTRRRR